MTVATTEHDGRTEKTAREYATAVDSAARPDDAVAGKTHAEAITEYVDSCRQNLRVDRTLGIVRGVKILGLTSSNGRVYSPAAIRKAARLYEGTKVNVNHPQGHASFPRDYRDRIGMIRSVTVREGDGLFGDLHFNPKHPLADQLAWDAMNAPGNVGLSHNVEARVTPRDHQVVVEEILKVQSVDLVADPATTQGLFENAAPSAGADEDVESLRRRNQELLLECERLQAREDEQRKRAVVDRLLTEHQLVDPATGTDDSPIVSNAFVQSLLGAPDDETRRALVEDRARLVASLRETPRPRPVSREQGADGDAAIAHSTKDFAAAIRGM